MMAKRIGKKEVAGFVKDLSRNYTVIGPVKKQDQYVFTELDEDDRLELDYPRTILPLKKYLVPSSELMFKLGGEKVEAVLPQTRYAFVGLHICEINAIKRLDMVLHDDPYYKARRDNMLVIGVSCKPTDECFCQSMEANVLPEGVCDIFLKEDGDGYTALAGSEAGRRLLSGHRFQPSDKKILKVKVEYDDKKHVDLEKVWANMVKNYSSPLWDEMAKVCLGCANCTVVCPLCYCYDVQDITAVSPENPERHKCWDSCTLLNFATVTGGHKFRKDIKSRFKNIYTHKFKSYVDEFSVTACVGCGRCITFCPAGINMKANLERLEV
jgi:sulfhydrogenase subunit beta (sulfur reductase)